MGFKFNPFTGTLDIINVPLSGVEILHSSLSGLSADDHTQYLLADGTRDLTGSWGVSQDIAFTANAGVIFRSANNNIRSTSANQLDLTAGGTAILKGGTSTLTINNTSIKANIQIDANSNKIINVTDPDTDQGAATKKYHDDNKTGIATSGTSQAFATGSITFKPGTSITIVRAGSEFTFATTVSATSVSGANTEMLYNSGGTIDGTEGMTWDQTNFLVSGATKLQLRASGGFLHSAATGSVVLESDSQLTVQGLVETNVGVAGDIVLGDSTQRDMRPQTDLKTDLGTSGLRFNDAFIHGLHVQQSVDNVSVSPTDAELDTAFGTPATLGRGFIGTLDDASLENAVYLCITTDNSWWVLSMVKAL